jgi:Recombination endonuclease VII
VSCKQAEAGTPHAKRPVVADGLCDSCRRGRKRARKRSARLSSVRSRYGLSGADLDALRAAQHGRCACGRPFVTGTPRVDHDHRCGHCGGAGCRRCVRGLLCDPCNVFLGHVRDRPEALINLARHLVLKPAQKVLTDLDRQGKL